MLKATGPCGSPWLFDPTSKQRADGAFVAPWRAVTDPVFPAFKMTHPIGFKVCEAVEKSLGIY